MQGIRIFLSSKAGCCVFAFSKFQLNALNAQCQRLGEKTLLCNSFCGKWGYLKKYYEISSMDAYDNASCQIWQKFFIWMCQFWTLKGTLRLAFKRTRMGVSIEVNPARSLGKEMLDAGRVIFTKGSRLDFNRSFGPLGANLAVYHFFRVSIPTSPKFLHISVLIFWYIFLFFR